ncbi:MAG: efflux RND transporter permease subunit [Chlamydiales bacterium]
MNEEQSTHKGPVAWMAQNHVAANLLMILFIVGGLIVASRIKQEVFPEYELDIIRVEVEYPGASPEEVEEGIILGIEDEVRSLDGVKKVTSTSFEGRGIVTIELLRDVDASSVLQDVKNAVDKIQSFPEESETPIVSLVDARRQVISLIIYGDQSKRTLRDLAEKVREDLIGIEGITLVEISAIPPLEISVEVPLENLRRYGLTLQGIAQLIKQTALDLPAGGIKAGTGEVLLRTSERRDFAGEFATIPVVSTVEGSLVSLSDIATVKEKFEDTDEEAYFNGEPAVRIDVYRVGDQNPLDISKKVRTYISEISKQLPSGIGIEPWNDRAEIYQDRIDLLLRNAFMGLALVLLLLGLFLEPRLAFWVTVGIPISIIGSFLFIPWTEASVNMISLFAFIVTLGIIVDDAILVGENVYYCREKGMGYQEAAIEGAMQMTGPVTFAVMTNITAFIPLLFVPGSTGKLFLQIPAIVISVFLVSLIESLFVLPAHLSHEPKENSLWTYLKKPSEIFEKYLKFFIDRYYVPALELSLQYRYLTMTFGICLILIVVGFYFTGHLQFSYLPRVDSDLVQAQAVLPYGSPIQQARLVQERFVEGAKTITNQNKGKIVRGIYSQIGSSMPGFGPPNPALEGKGAHLVGTQVFLVPSDQREIAGVEFANQWRNLSGNIPEAESSNYTGTIQTSGSPLEIQLSHSNIEVLEQAASELASKLQEYKGVKDIDDGVTLGKPQLSILVKSEGRSLGITSESLAQQLRSAFFGAEALRQVRGREEMKVMVRLPEEERNDLTIIDELILRTPRGGEIPLKDAAEIIPDRAYTSIRRSEGKRVISVTADVEEGVANANEVLEDVIRNHLPLLLRKYPGISYSLEGEQREQAESLEAIGVGFIFAIIFIYSLLAIPFKSYTQPLIVMMSIPFGVIGAVIGHLLLGYEMSIISMFGLIALTGVVINDSLIMVITINRNIREKGKLSYEGVLEGGSRRFRPIVLTSLTTFFGLSPMIFETSMQARFLIPMAISLGFGILFSTVIILFITTSAYMIIEDVKSLFMERKDRRG